MSRIITIGKPFSYESPKLKTPTFKEISPAPCSYDSTKDETPHPPILMDEFGQTPDHFYLAKKPPPSFFQVKRKLDLQSVGSAQFEFARPIRIKQRKKLSPEKSEGCLASDKTRYSTSLGQLTKKFLKLLSDATDGIVNLNTACSMLAVPKRRLYDITNVLEGVGLVQKTSRNNIQWMGRISSPCTNVNKYELEKEIDILEAKENKLDELIYYMNSQMNKMSQDEEGDEEAKYRYITGEDLQNIKEFSDQTVISIGASLADIEETSDTTVVIKTPANEMEAYLLCNDGSPQKLTIPVVVENENSCEVKDGNDASLQNLPNPRGVSKENSFEANGENKIVEANESNLSNKKICLNGQDISAINPMEMYKPSTSGVVWSKGDTVIKNAFITEEDDIAPIDKNFLLETEDQDLDLQPFSVLETPLEDYSFSLDFGEGLRELFDFGFSDD